MHKACESTSGYISNDYQSKISFISTKLPKDYNVALMLKQAAVRSLSCEIVPGKEGPIYFGDSIRGHFLGNTFFLKDAQARGFHRWYSIVIFMKDKHFLLNSWTFFEDYINRLILHLQEKAAQVFSYEKKIYAQRKFGLAGTEQKHPTTAARSLIELTDSAAIFVQLHLWFTWLLSAGAKRLEESTPIGMFNNFSSGHSEESDKKVGTSTTSFDNYVRDLRKLRSILGSQNFQKIIYSTLIGQQVIVRGPKAFVNVIINLLKLFVPSNKCRCIGFSETYRLPNVCRILGLDLFAAVPKSCDHLVRLDIVPVRALSSECLYDFEDAYKHYNFIFRSETKLPERLPSLLLKIDKSLSDQTLSERAVWLHVSSLIEQWIHTAAIIREIKKKCNRIYYTNLLNFLNVQDQDEVLIKFWIF